MLLSGIYFFNVAATTEIYTYFHTLSLHDPLPISAGNAAAAAASAVAAANDASAAATSADAAATSANAAADAAASLALPVIQRSEEHTSELQSLMSNSYAVFCLNKKQKRLTT